MLTVRERVRRRRKKKAGSVSLRIVFSVKLRLKLDRSIYDRHARRVFNRSGFCPRPDPISTTRSS